jgi:hypothetical protein
VPLFLCVVASTQVEIYRTLVFKSSVKWFFSRGFTDKFTGTSLLDMLTYFPVPIEFSCGKPSETLQESLSAERSQEHPRRALRLRLRKGGLLLPPRWRVGPASRGIDPVDSRGQSHPRTRADVHVHVRLCTYAADSSYELSDALLHGCDVGG